jgi:hypothetical protein
MSSFIKAILVAALISLVTFLLIIPIKKLEGLEKKVDVLTIELTELKKEILKR